MAIMKVAAFGGMQPIVDPTLLPDNYAERSQDAWLYSGALIGFPVTPNIHTLVNRDAGKVYRIPKSYGSPGDFAGSFWMEFDDPATDVVRSPVFDEKFDRYYWCGANTPPTYNTRENIEAGGDPYFLGVPAPARAPTIKNSEGSSTVLVSRAYVYTYVSAYGEEGPPSPPALVNGNQGDLWKVTCFNPSSADQGTDRNLTHYRIYRTVTSSAGVATFYLLGEFPLPVEVYTDVKADFQITGALTLESTNWTAPPRDLQGFCMMPNGMLVGWRESEIWVSEAYRPHAWPPENVFLTEYPVVGLGIFNQSLVVCTAGFPVVATGTTPLAVTTTKLTLFEPCVSRMSILSTPEGVYYASPNGLVVVSDTAQLVTAQLASKDQWQQLQKPAKIHAARLGMAYYAYGTTIPVTFQTDAFQNDAFQMADETGSHDGLMLDVSNPRVALTELTSAAPVQGVQTDVWSNEVFILRNGQVQWLNQSDASILTAPTIWRSKLFQTSKPRNYAALKVYFVVPPGTPAPPPVRDTALVQALGSKWGVVRMFCDEGTLISTHELRKSGELLRLPSDREYDFCQIELETRVRVRSAVIASTAKELAMDPG